MSKFSKLGLRRAAGACAVAAVAAIGLASMGPGNAAAAPLPNGYKSTTGIDGEVVQVWRTAESARPIPSQANNGAGRVANLSGTYTAKLSSGVAGNIALSYIVGCQVDLGTFSLGATGTISVAPSVTGSVSFPLSPGKVAVVSITSKDIASGVGVIQTLNYAVEVQGCAGYASARSLVQVIAAKGYNTDDGSVNGNGTLIQTNLYGKPFSLN